MKYAVIRVINGNYLIHAEGFTDANKAKAAYHGLCQTLWGSDDVTTACVMVVDENLNVIDGCREYIQHETTE